MRSCLSLCCRVERSNRTCGGKAMGSQARLWARCAVPSWSSPSNNTTSGRDSLGTYERTWHNVTLIVFEEQKHRKLTIKTRLFSITLYLRGEQSLRVAISFSFHSRRRKPRSNMPAFIRLIQTTKKIHYQVKLQRDLISSFQDIGIFYLKKNENSYLGQDKNVTKS